MAAVGLFLLCGPPVGAIAGASVVAILAPRFLGDSPDSDPVVYAVVVYALGSLPAALTGVVAGLVPFGRWRTYVPICAVTGFAVASAEILLLLLTTKSGADLEAVVGAAAMVGATGAIAATACGALVRRLFRKAALPQDPGRVFT